MTTNLRPRTDRPDEIFALAAAVAAAIDAGDIDEAERLDSEAGKLFDYDDGLDLEAVLASVRAGDDSTATDDAEDAFEAALDADLAELWDRIEDDYDPAAVIDPAVLDAARADSTSFRTMRAGDVAAADIIAAWTGHRPDCSADDLARRVAYRRSIR